MMSWIPEFYHHWLDSVTVDLAEPSIDCGRCLMVEPQWSGVRGAPFDRGLKCCTYFPYVPNFTLGKLWSEGDSATRLRLEFAMGSGHASLLGLRESYSFKQMRAQLGLKAFGRNRELLCPFFDSAHENCSIWPHRPGVCAAYQCRSGYGEKGQMFWAAAGEFLNLFEWTLAHEVLWRLGFTQDDLRAAEKAAGWEFSAPEVQWYARCYQEALRVTPAEILHLMSNHAQDHATESDFAHHPLVRQLAALAEALLEQGPQSSAFVSKSQTC